jgi:hypothetical protein
MPSLHPNKKSAAHHPPRICWAHEMPNVAMQLFCQKSLNDSEIRNCVRGSLRKDGRIPLPRGWRPCQYSGSGSTICWLLVFVDSALYCDTKIKFGVGVQSFERQASKLLAR